MSSGLVTRYAELSRNKTEDVEQLWRGLKRERPSTIRRNNWPRLVFNLRKSLGLTESQCSVVYVDSLVRATVLSETASSVLVELEDSSYLDRSLRESVRRFNGVIWLPYSRISNSLYGNLIEMTDSAAVGPVGTTGPVGANKLINTTGLTGTISAKSIPRKSKLMNGLSIRVGKGKGKIKKVGNLKSLIMFDDGNESEVDNGKIEVLEEAYDEFLQKLWNSMDRHLMTESIRKNAFKELVKYHFELTYLTDHLVDKMITKIT